MVSLLLTRAADAFADLYVSVRIGVRFVNLIRLGLASAALMTKKHRCKRHGFQWPGFLVYAVASGNKRVWLRRLTRFR